MEHRRELLQDAEVDAVQNLPDLQICMVSFFILFLSSGKVYLKDHRPVFIPIIFTVFNPFCLNRVSHVSEIEQVKFEY